MAKKAMLVLEDGAFYEGCSFGAETSAYGEVVFNTSMTGYQEMLTDPSYAGQIVVLTYPLVGNYGINTEDIESKQIQVSGFVVRELCERPSHWQSTKTLSQYLAENDIPGVSGVDSRALTRRLRSAGVMMGIITLDESPEEALKRLESLPRYDDIDFVRGISTPVPYRWEEGPVLHQPLDEDQSLGSPHIVAIDCGLRYSILRILRRLGCRVSAVPATFSAEDILKLRPEGIVLSPGPGDPALLGYMEETVRALIGTKPIMGICLGHQLMGRAFGGRTFKLKFGHRGANHPVRDLETGRVHITTQNHGYAVDAQSLHGGLEVSHINLNDGTVEGLRHRQLPILSIQYHAEASPGPLDNVYLFERFLEMVMRERGS
ncbi:MAG: glutamine-hydrolyzing carbamoyl-phosphate synthase small subunit [Dehalococcoidia bacterium]